MTDRTEELQRKCAAEKDYFNQIMLQALDTVTSHKVGSLPHSFCRRRGWLCVELLLLQ